MHCMDMDWCHLCRERDLARRDLSSLDSQDSSLDFTFGSLQEFREYKESQRQAKQQSLLQQQQQQQQQPTVSMQEEADSQRRASSSRASSTGSSSRSSSSSNNGSSRGGNRGRSSRKDYFDMG